MKQYKLTTMMTIGLLFGCFEGVLATGLDKQSSTQSTEKVMQSKMEHVDSSHVCMVNNTYFKKKQIEVSVNKKKYYGCCAMCKKKLENDASLRHAIDPYLKSKVAKKAATVDKAKAYIVKDSKDNVYYFKNEKNYKAYMALKK